MTDGVINKLTVTSAAEAQEMRRQSRDLTQLNDELVTVRSIILKIYLIISYFFLYFRF